MTDLDSRQIEQLVDGFYKEALADALLGPVFREVAHFELEEHSPAMYRFWRTLIFDTHEYCGSAFKPHEAIHKMSPLNEEHFARWLALFGEAADQYLDLAGAARAKAKAKSIAWAMMSKLQNTATAAQAGRRTPDEPSQGQFSQCVHR